MGLGPFPFVSLSQARQRARECHTLIHQGKDPLVERREAASQRKIREETKFSAIAEMYIEEHKFEWTNKKHASDWASTLKRLAYEKLDGKPLADLTTRDVLDVLKPLWQDKRETGRKLQGRLKLIFAYAKTANLYEGENPALWQGHLSNYLGKNLKPYQIKHHRALDYKRAPNFYSELLKIETISSRALQFTMLTASRTSEVRAAERIEFNLDKKIWRVPETRMKARKPHIVPLSEDAAVIIEKQLTSNNSQYLFHSFSPEKPLSNMAMLNLVNKQLSSYDTTVHGLRSTFRTWAGEETNYSSGLVEFALAHQLDKRVEGAYLRSELVEPRRPLMCDWAGYLKGKKMPPSVVPVTLN